jgi:shikimate 5-dehydrogenase
MFYHLITEPRTRYFSLQRSGPPASRENAMNSTVEGKVIVITGASSGLGEAAARLLASQGAKLVLGARRADRLRALAKELDLEAAAIVQTDVTDRAQVKRLVDHAVETHGRIDVLIWPTPSPTPRPPRAYATSTRALAFPPIPSRAWSLSRSRSRKT